LIGEIRVSVIVPAYNEQETILDILTEVKLQKIEAVEFEVIVVDDCSTDGTVSLLEDNADLYASLVRLEKNVGKGAAVKAGLELASGDFILFQDADMEYHPEEYKKLLEPVRKYNADLVMSSRFAAPDYTRVVYFWNKMGNRLITFLFNILNNTTFTDIYSCYMLFRRDLVPSENLKYMAWSQHAEILSIAQKSARVIYEVPISYHGRTLEEGKKIRPYHIISVVWAIFVCRFFR